MEHSVRFDEAPVRKLKVPIKN